jgi:hypothetical protein
LVLTRFGSSKKKYSIMAYVPADIVNNDAKLVISPQMPVTSTGKLEISSIGAYISARAIRFDVGVRMILKAVLDGSPLTFYTVGTIGSAVGATVSGSMVGTWNNAFGLSGLAVSNLSATVSFLPPSTVTAFGISGGFRLGESSVAIAGHVDPIGSNYGVQGRFTGLSLDGLARFALAGSSAASAILAARQSNVALFKISNAVFSAADDRFAAGNVVYEKGVSLSASGTILGTAFSASVVPKTTMIGAIAVQDFNAAVTIQSVSLSNILQAIKDSGVWGTILRNMTIAYVANTVPAFQQVNHALLLPY